MTIRSKVKDFLKRKLSPNKFNKIRQFYIQYISFLFNKNEAKIIKNYTDQFISIYGYNIIDGPFKGLRYTKQSVGSSFFHKLVGYYEAVLIPYIDEVKKIKIDNILDIGAAEGFYTTGFGKFFPNASIIAFEIDKTGQTLIQDMYSINNLNNKLVIQGEANKYNIIEHIKENTLLICDCEGAEKAILDIDNKNIYKNIAYGIIELHDEIIPGCKESVISYFKNTHNIETIKFKFADPTEFTFLKNINKNDLNILLRERGIQDQEWIILRIK